MLIFKHSFGIGNHPTLHYLHVHITCIYMFYMYTHIMYILYMYTHTCTHTHISCTFFTCTHDKHSLHVHTHISCTFFTCTHDKHSLMYNSLHIHTKRVCFFQLLYDTLKQSQDLLTHFDLVTFNPDNIKSQYFFLSRIIEMLSHLTHLTISKVYNRYMYIYEY